MTLLAFIWSMMANMPVIVILTAMLCDTFLFSVAMLAGVIHL